LLAQHPEIEEKLHAEIASVLGDRPPTIEDLARLPYTEYVYTEAMRLFPPVWGIFRDCKMADTINGYHIAPGTVILLSPWVIHHDARFYTDPEEFRPERWEKPSEQHISRYAYVPFGGGQRLCIGNVFALAAIARKWRFTLDADCPFELFPTITIRPKYGIKVVAHQRS
jgi:cytochrome P450